MWVIPERWAWLRRHMGDRADTAYVTPDWQWVGVVTTRVAAALAVGVVAVSLAHPLAVMLLLAAAAIGIPRIGRRVLLRSGSKRSVLRKLERLSRGNVVFNDIRVPSPDKLGAEVPIDFLVVTQKGYVVVAVRGHRGIVQGDVADSTWTADKLTRRRARPIRGRMENPVAQVRRQIFALSRVTNGCGVKSRISGLVVFSHPEAELRVTGEDPIRVIREDELLRHLPKRDSTGAGRRASAVIGLMRARRTELRPIADRTAAVNGGRMPDVPRRP